MSSLKEIKGRIGSVRSTLKITSAMKLVASAKMRSAQKAAEDLFPYQAALQDILEALPPVEKARATSECKRVAIVAVSSNSSLCGGFNSNIIRFAKARIAELKAEGVEEVEVFSVGKKMAEAMNKEGLCSPGNFDSLVAGNYYEKSAALASDLIHNFEERMYDRVELLYNHFVNPAVQRPQCDIFLPFTFSFTSLQNVEDGPEFILEPSLAELRESLIPKVCRLKLHAVILDSQAAEQAARMEAMQTATDNGNNILRELTLAYNKGRQQKITEEILDIAGGLQ